MAKPISPKSKFAKKFPDQVIEAFNELIAKNMRDGEAKVSQDEVVALIVSKMGVDRADVFDNSWLDVESLYEKHGWTVTYDKPAYYESYGAFFVFSKESA